MKRIALILASLWAAIAFAQALYMPTVPAGISAMPAPSLTISTAQTFTLSWDAVTELNTGAALPSGSSIYYDLWQVNGSTVTLVASGITSTTYQVTAHAAGTDCYVVDATLNQPGTTPQYVESNASNGWCATVTIVAKPYGPDNLTGATP